MRDHGIPYCEAHYPRWRIGDMILNTKWKYLNKSYSCNNPIIDRLTDIRYKDVREASIKNNYGHSEDYIKNNFGEHKNYTYISDFDQFQECLPIYMTCSSIIGIDLPYFKSAEKNEHTFRNMMDLHFATGEHFETLRDYIDKDVSYDGHFFRTISFEEQFRLNDPVIINDKEYDNIFAASRELKISKSIIAYSVNRMHIFSRGKRYIVRSKEDESFIKDEDYPFDLDKKLANKMLTKLKEKRNSNSILELFYS